MEMEWLGESGPLGVCVVLVAMFLKYMKDRDTAFQKHIAERDDTMVALSKQMIDMQEKTLFCIDRNTEMLGIVIGSGGGDTPDDTYRNIATPPHKRNHRPRSLTNQQ